MSSPPIGLWVVSETDMPVACHGVLVLYACSNVALGGEMALGPLWLQIAATYKCFSWGSGDSPLFSRPAIGADPS